MDTNTGMGTQISALDAETLKGTARWGRFLSILGFVMIGLMVIAAFFFGSLFAQMGSAMSGQAQPDTEQMRELEEALQEMEGMEGVDLSQFEEQRHAAGSAAAFSGTMFTIMFLVSAALYFVPTLLLYQFSSRTLKALSGPFDASVFSSGLAAHRRMYKFIGILTIVLLALYLVFILIFIAVGVGAGLSR